MKFDDSTHSSELYDNHDPEVFPDVGITIYTGEDGRDRMVTFEDEAMMQLCHTYPGDFE